MPLTDQKRRYAEARMAGTPKKQAAIAAGCPEKTASQAASRYEKDPDVKAFMARKGKLESERKPASEKSAAVAIPASEIEPPEAPYIPPQADDPMDYLMYVMNDLMADPKHRLDAAKALLPYKHRKVEETGKKQSKEDAAKEVARGKFAASPPPLRAVK